MADNEEVEIVLKGKFENGKLLVDTTKQVDKNIESIGGSSQKTEGNVSSLQRGLKKLAAVVGIGYLAVQFKNLVKGSLKAAGAMEQVDIALTTMLGSAEKSAQLQKDLIEFAKKTPFEIEGIFSTTKQLLAYGIAQEDIIDTMSNLGNIASGVGVDMQRLALVFGQVRSTGKLLGQDLNQFTQAGVPLLAELAKLLGTTESEVIKLKESGQISFDLVNQALKNMTAEGGRFYNLMQNQSKTFLGTISNMADGFYGVKVALGNALLPAAKRVVNFMIPALDKLQKSIERNSGAITKFANGVITALKLIALPFKLIFQLLSQFRQSVENITVAVYVGLLNISKGFHKLKLTILDFVESTLDRLSLLSKLPMFGWIGDAQQKFTSLKDSVISDIEDINSKISDIKAVQEESSISINQEETPSIEDSQATQTITTLSPEETEKDKLTKLKEENQQLLEEQKNYLAGYAKNQSESDQLIAQNKTLARQQELLQEGEFIARKQELDQQLLDNEIGLEEYKKELLQMNNEAKLEALQEQYDAELVKFEENQALMNETKNEMQLAQDEIETLQLQQKLDNQGLIHEAHTQKLVQLKVNLEKFKVKEETAADKFRTFMEKKHIKGATQAAGELVKLQNSKSKEIAAIGKAAAIFQITQDTARGAISAYSSLAPIPFVGPALGAAAAAAVIAYGAEQLSTVKSNSFAVGTPNIPEDQMANVHKGEMIVPATFSDAIRSGQLTLSANGNLADNIQQQDATITNININFDGAQFVGQMNDDDIVEIGERLGQLIAEDIIPVLPTKNG